MEPTHHSKNNPMTVPVAIIVAGGLIAAAIFLRGNTNLSQPVTAQKPDTVVAPSELGTLALRPVDETRDHIRGNPNANIVIVEFSDTECPFCKRFHETMKQVINEYGKSGKVAWVYRQFPIVGLHPKAPKESEALECAGELGGNTKFWEYTDRIFDVTPSNDGLDPVALPRIAREVGLDEAEFKACLESGRHAARVQADYEDGVIVGVNGTPHSVFVLREPVGAAAKTSLLEYMEQFRDPRGNLPVSFSLDGFRIGLGGALPLDAVKKTVATLLK